MTWRDKFRPVIRFVLDSRGDPHEGLRIAWRETVCPLLKPCQRTTRSYEYRIWRDEIAKQTGRKRKPGRKIRTSKRVLRKISAAEARRVDTQASDAAVRRGGTLMIRTLADDECVPWYCPECRESGVLLRAPHTDTAMLIGAIHAAHRNKSPACQEKALRMVRAVRWYRDTAEIEERP